jgi:hypothetical protein
MQCSHKQAWLVKDPEPLAYSVMCQKCFLCTDRYPKGLQAKMAWLALLRAEVEDRRLVA